MSTVHNLQTDTEGIHTPFNWQYANAASRTGASGFVTDDLYKLALQTDNYSIWILTAITPTWQDITAVAAVASVFGRTGTVVAAASDYDGDQVDFTPAGNIAATDVQAAIEELDDEKLALTGGTLSGDLNVADNELIRGTLRDTAETVNIIGAIGGGTQDIDLELGNVVSATVDTGATTFTFSNPPATGNSGGITLYLTNGGSQTVNWPASVDWAGGTAPTLTAAGIDVLTFTTIDGGTTWYGFAAGIDMQ